MSEVVGTGDNAAQEKVGMARWQHLPLGHIKIGSIIWDGNRRETFHKAVDYFNCVHAPESTDLPAALHTDDVAEVYLNVMKSIPIGRDIEGKAFDAAELYYRFFLLSPVKMFKEYFKMPGFMPKDKYHPLCKQYEPEIGSLLGGEVRVLMTRDKCKLDSVSANGKQVYGSYFIVVDLRLGRHYMCPFMLRSTLYEW